MKFRNFEASTYDLLGYLLPGFLVISEIFVFFEGFNALITKIVELSNVEIIFLIISSYMAGHLVQSFSNVLEQIFSKIKFLKYISGTPDYQYLSEENKFYSPELKKAIREAFKKVFKLEKINEKEIFNLCYTLIQQKMETTNLNLFVSLYGFYRGLSYACLIGVVLLIIQLNFLSSFIFMIFWFLFLQRYKRFKSYFEDYVYRYFYVYYLTSYKHE